MKHIVTLILLLSIGQVLTGQTPHLDVEGDARIVGNVNVIAEVGDSSLFIGANAGMSDDGTNNKNTFLGTNAGRSNTSGSSNSFFGRDAGKMNTMGVSNSFFGDGAGKSNTTGYSNSIYGNRSGDSNTTGKLNSFFGQWSGGFNTTGENNSFFGQASGLSNYTGGSNSFFGRSAGSRYNNSRSTMLGYDAETTDSLDRAIAIGHNARVDCDNCAVIGGTGDDAVMVGISTTTPQAKLHIEGGVDASFTATSGYLINGPTDGRNMVIDDNEILARNNGAPSDLFINAASGNVAIGLTVDPTEKLDVSGNVRIRNMPTGTGDIVRIDANGKLWKSSSVSARIDDADELLKKYQSDTIDNKKLITKLTAENEDLKKRLARLEAIVLGSSN